MTDRPQRAGRRGILAAAAAVLALTGAIAVTLGLTGHDGPPAPNAAQAAVPAPTSTSAASPAPGSDEEDDPSAGDAVAAPIADLGPVLPASAPVALDIPSIEVHSTNLVPLSVGADGVLPAPTDFAAPGWYTGGPNPGQFGPAVIAGHVDGPTGPAIFYRLGELTPGAQVDVTREDGTVAHFIVDSVTSYAKADFPTSLVYGNTTNRAELRLITCGGAFDRATGHYVDNIIVFAHLTA